MIILQTVTIVWVMGETVDSGSDSKSFWRSGRLRVTYRMGPAFSHTLEETTAGAMSTR